MKKIILLAFAALAFSFSVNADPVFFKWHRAAKEDVQTSRALSYNSLNFDPAPLNGYLSQFGMRQEFHKGMTAIGYEDFAAENPIDAAFCLAWMLPQEGWAGVATDSLNFKVGGWQLMTSLFGFDLVKSETFDFTIGPMWNWGGYRIKKNAAGESMKKYVNAFDAPGGRADIRLHLGRFIIGGRAMYGWDISNPKWKRKSPNLEILPNQYNRGWNFAGYIGFQFD